MLKKALNYKGLEKYTLDLSHHLKGRHLYSPKDYSDGTFVFNLSGKEGGNLVISLDPSFPRIYLNGDKVDAPSFDSSFLGSLRKEMANAYIEDVEVFNSDRILKIFFLSTNKIFQEEAKSLYLELIPLHPNLIITDRDDKIILAYHETSLADKRPILKGLNYLPPLNNFHGTNYDEGFVYADFHKACLEAEEELERSRKKARFGWLFKALKNKKSALERKITTLLSDIEEAKKHLNDSTKGDAIYINYASIDKKLPSFVYEGETIELDSSLSLSKNAERYYKRSKKAKKTIEQDEKFVALAKKELEKTSIMIKQLEIADETGLEEFAKELRLIKNKQKEKGTSKLIFARDSLPYFVNYNGTKIFFGKSAKQNSFLTFLYLTNKKNLFFHIKGESGAHVIIQKEEPNAEEIRTASEICLLLSQKEDGEVMYCPRHHLKKGRALGQVIMNEYKSVYLRKIRNETKDLLNVSSRVEII